MTSSESDESSSSHKPDAEDAELLARLKTQIEFYFSSENLSRDQYLKSLLWEEPAGAAPLAVIANFPKVRDILGSVESNASQTQTQSLIRQALHSSTQLTLSPDALWIVPNSPVPPNNAQTSNNWYQTHHVHQHQSMPVYPQVWHGPHPYAHPPHQHQHQHYPPAAQPYAPHYPQHAPVYSHHPVPHPHAMHPPQYHHSVYPAYYVSVPSSTSAPFHSNNTNINNNSNNNFGKGKNPKKDNSNNNNNNTAKNNRKTKKNFETKEGAPMENYSHSKLKKNPSSSSSSNYNFDKSSKPNHNKFTAKSKTRDKNNASSSSSSSSSGITEEKHKNNDLKEADLSCTVAFPALGGGTSSTTNSNSNDAKNEWKVPPTSSGYAQALLRSNDTTTTATASQTSSLLSAVDVIEDVVVKSTGNTPSKVEKEEENTGVVDQLEELHINGKNDGDGMDGVKRLEDEKHKSQEKSDKVLTTSTTASPSNAEASHEKSNGVDDKEVLPQEELHLKSNAEQQNSTMNTDTPTQQQPQQQQATTSTNHHQMVKEESSSKASSKENTIIFTEEENPPLPTQTLESCTKKVVAGGAWGNKPLFVDVIRKEA